MVTKKKRIFQFNPTSVKWIKAVKYYINGECDGNAEKCMLKAGFAKTTSRAHNHQLKHHPDYIAWQKTQTKKNLITKEFLEEQLHRIITDKNAAHSAQVAAIGKAMEMFGFIAPKKLELAGDPDKPIRFTFGTENLKPPASAPKNRMTGFIDGK